MARRGAGPEPDVAKGKLSAKGLREVVGLYRYIYPYRVKFIFGLVFLALSSVTTLAFPYIVGDLVDAGLKGSNLATKDLSAINQAAQLLFLILIVQAVFSFFRIIWFVEVGEKAIADLRRDLFGKLLSFPMAFFGKNRVGELTSRLSSDISQIQDTFTTTLAELLRGTAHILIGIGLLLFISLKLTMVMLASFPVVLVVAIFFGRYIRKLSRKTQDKLAEAGIVVEESLQGIQNVKTFTNEPFEYRRYSSALTDVVGLALKNAKYRGAFASFIIFALFGSIVLVIWYGSVLVQAGSVTIGQLIQFLLYSMFVGGAIGSLGEQFAQVLKTIGATERVRELLAEPGEVGILPAKTTQPSGVRLQGAIAFQDVSFRYPTREEIAVLKGVSFEAKPGEKIALVGPSGAGKSTVVSLLARLYEPTEGSVLIDNKLAESYDLQYLRSQMALVPQEVMLFGGTIRENIAYGRLGATEAEVIEAANQANAWDFIQGFPHGLDTIVGDRGIKLSGGQRQRIAIARAVLRNPAILILDEATSSLDSESERLVQEALEKLMEGRTTVIIAHRLATVREADKILVLQHGQVVEQGRHEELVQLEGGLYRSLAALQFTDNHAPEQSPILL